MQSNQSTSAGALIEPSGFGPAHRRLAAGIRAAIRDGRLGPGDALPASRNLAGDLELSRWVVTEAYQQLIAEGYLTARAGSATRVTAAAAASSKFLPTRDTSDVDEPPAGAIDLRPGLPDVAGFPRTAWSRAYASVVRTLEPSQWVAPHPLGVWGLRSTVADYLRRTRGVNADPEQVVITGGTVDAMRHLSRLLMMEGRFCLAVEDPGWPILAATAASEALVVRPVPVDREGLVVDALPSGTSAVLVTPAHQFPTGVAMSGTRRSQLLRWAASTGGVVVEDDYDADFRFDRRPLGALAGLDPDHVIYLGSVSKTLTPALRLGWMVVPPALSPSIGVGFASSSRSALEQHALATFISGGDYDRHLRRMRRQYELRRGALLTSLHRRVPPSVELVGVSAGLHLLIRLPDAAAETRAVQRLLAHGIWTVPLSRYQYKGTDAGIVVGYARLAPQNADDVSRRLAEACTGLAGTRG